MLRIDSLAWWVEYSPLQRKDLGSIPGDVIQQFLKMVLDTSLLNTQQHKVRVKGKVEQSRESSNAFH